MSSYRCIALAVMQVDLTAENAEEADTIIRHMDPTTFELVEWVGTQLLIKQGKEFIPIPEYSQPELFSETHQAKEPAGGRGQA